ncbi:GNAT family N-acetyltransferase [Novosphingobium terrae]|uniref:GNAT family N-acetyltransferase n=1 Tax=Novosphingobium terrae TaxID=2726189 RepID=UPI00197CC292|nr:GNAT family N-acetyltransferase [Novosphingobium terrae]
MSRIRIKSAIETDAEELIAANRNSVGFHAPWVRPFTDRTGFEAWFAGLDGTRAVGLVARNAASNAPVGVFTFSQIVRGPFQSAYLGFYGLEGQLGQGLITDALRASIVYAFSRLELHRVEANVQPTNHRSLALVARAGFRKEGYSPAYLYIDGAWRDHERWAILAD